MKPVPVVTKHDGVVRLVRFNSEKEAFIGENRKFYYTKDQGHIWAANGVFTRRPK